MIGRNVARRYAGALFEIGSEQGALDRFQQDLTRIVEMIDGEEIIRKALYHPLISVADKQALVEDIFRDQVAAETLNLLRLLVTKKRETILAAILDEFERLVNAAENIADVVAEVAMPLEGDVTRQLHNDLTKATGKKVNLQVKVNPELIGGMVLHIGDRRMDGSVKGRLAHLRDMISDASVR